MHTTIQTLAWALVFANAAYAESMTTDQPYEGDEVVTSYYTWCPDETTTTTGPAPGITADPAHLTLTGDDGRTTIYRTETTILPHMCPGGDGVCGATYTLSEECPCKAEATAPASMSNQCPKGFTTTVVSCTVCADNGGPMTVTLTVPMPDGPYATVTPQMGSPVNNPADVTSSAVESTPTQSGSPAVSKDTNEDATSTGTDKADSYSGDDTGSDDAAQSSTGMNNNAAPSHWADDSTKPQATQYHQPYIGSAIRLGSSFSEQMAIIGVGAIGALAFLL